MGANEKGWVNGMQGIVKERKGTAARSKGKEEKRMEKGTNRVLGMIAGKCRPAELCQG